MFRSNNIQGKSAAILGVSLLAIAVSNANAGEPEKLKAGAVDITPTLNISESRNDNIYSASSNETSSNIFVINPGILAEIKSGESTYSLDAQLTDGSYSEGSDDDYTDYSVGANADIAINSSNMLKLGALVSGNHEDRGSGTTAGLGGTNTSVFDEPVEFDQETYTVGYVLGSNESTFRIELGAGLDDIEYTNFKIFTAPRNYEKQDLGATVFYKVSSKTDLFVEYNTADFDYDLDLGFLDRSGDEDKILIGATWQATGNTTGTIKVGQVDKEFDGSSRDDFSGTTWLAQVDWTPSEQTLVSVNSSQAPRETSQGGNFIESASTGASWTQGWTSSISTTVSASIGEDDYDGSSRSDDLTNYGISLDYEFRRWMTVGLTYENTETDSNNDVFDFDREIVGLTLSLSL